MASRAGVSRIVCLAMLLGLAAAGLAAADPPTIVSFNLGGALNGDSTITVQPGTNPASTGLTLTVDLRPIGGGIRAPYVDQGLVCDDDTRDNVFWPCFTYPLYTPPGTYSLTYTVSDAQGRSSSRTRDVTVVAPTDTDGDGLPDGWETAFGFNPAVAGDGALDSDADGATNVQELVAGTHPKGTFTRYFAEGADSSFFSTRLDLFNPSASPALVLVRMQASDGAQSSVLRTVAPFGTALVASNVPGNDYSIVVEADRLVVAERTVQWLPSDGSSFSTRTYGSHAESAIVSPGTTWYLAEGATHGAFDLFYLLQNPGNAPATVTIDYLRPAPLPPLVKTYTVGPRARRTIYVDAEGPELVATDVSATITSNVPIVAERAMYFSTPEQPFAAGHDGAASPVLATDWYLAEGAGNFFDTFILLANPGVTDASVTLTYLGEGGGTPITRTYTVAARSRLTVNPTTLVNGVGIFGVFATTVSSTVPIVVERAMWWPSGSTWREAHLVRGATALAVRWALAALEVRTGSYSLPRSGDAESFVMIANPSTTATTVTLSDGTRSTTQPLPGQSRLTLPVSVVEGLLRGRPGSPVSGTFPLIVQSAGPPIVVERASYRDAQGVFWADGSALLATPIP